MYYLYNQSGQDTGPFSLDELKAKLAGNEIAHNKLVRADGSEKWEPLSTVLPEAAETLPPNVPTCPKCQSADGLQVTRKVLWLFGCLLAIGLKVTLRMAGYYLAGSPSASSMERYQRTIDDANQVSWIVGIGVLLITPLVFTRVTKQCTACGYTERSLSE